MESGLFPISCPCGNPCLEHGSAFDSIVLSCGTMQLLINNMYNGMASTLSMTEHSLHKNIIPI